MSEDIKNLPQDSKWSNYFNKKAWIKYGTTKWPGYIYDPKSLPNHIMHSLRQKAVSLIDKKLFIKYFGMPEQAAYGFIGLKDITLYKGDDDPLYDQKQPRKYIKQYEDGIVMMRQSSGWDPVDIIIDDNVC